MLVDYVARMCGRIEIELYLLLGLQLGPSRQTLGLG